MQFAAARNLEPDVGMRILDRLTSALICLDRDRRITWLNATSEGLFENSSASLVGRSFDSLLSSQEASTISENLARDPISMTEHEAVITLANGKSLVADYSIYPAGETDGDVAILLEIRPLDRHAQIARDEFSHLQQLARQQLARGLAHEINNPLGGIRGAAQLLQRELDRPEWLEFTEIIISEVDRLQALIAGMLGPEMQAARKMINIYEVLEHIRKIIEAAEPERIELRRDYDPSIPLFLADRDLLIQAFLNIARNAVQAIDDRGIITIRTRVDRNHTIGQTTHPLVLKVDIVDNGRGISPALGESIFLPMITDKPDGTGLGLPIAQDIIFRHGGSLHMRSADGQTTFSTILPLEQP